MFEKGKITTAENQFTSILFLLDLQTFDITEHVVNSERQTCCQLTGSRYLKEERTLMLRLRAGGPEPVRQPISRSRGHVVSQSQRLLLQLLWSVPGQQTLTLTLQTHETHSFTQARSDVEEQSVRLGLTRV